MSLNCVVSLNLVLKVRKEERLATFQEKNRNVGYRMLLSPFKVLGSFDIKLNFVYYINSKFQGTQINGQNRTSY